MYLMVQIFWYGVPFKVKYLDQGDNLCQKWNIFSDYQSDGCQILYCSFEHCSSTYTCNHIITKMQWRTGHTGIWAMPGGPVCWSKKWAAGLSKNYYWIIFTKNSVKYRKICILKCQKSWKTVDYIRVSFKM